MKYEQNLLDALADYTNASMREIVLGKDKTYWIADLASIIMSGMTEDEKKEFIEALKIKEVEL
jgi:hypothetical protein